MKPVDGGKAQTFEVEIRPAKGTADAKKPRSGPREKEPERGDKERKS